MVGEWGGGGVLVVNEMGWILPVIEKDLKKAWRRKLLQSPGMVSDSAHLACIF